MRQVVPAQLGRDGVAFPPGAGDDADPSQRPVLGLDPFQVVRDERRLLPARLEVADERLGAAGQRRDAPVVVRAAVEVVDGAAGEEAGGPAAGLLGGAVVQAQLPRTAADVDAAAAQHHPVPAVDALVAVADDEEVVGPGGGDGAQQTVRRGAHVLALVHDHRGVVQGFRVVPQQGGGVAVRVVHLLQAPLRQLRAVLVEHAPRPGGGRRGSGACRGRPAGRAGSRRASSPRGPARPAPTRRRRSRREGPGRGASGPAPAATRPARGRRRCGNRSGGPAGSAPPSGRGWRPRCGPVRRAGRSRPDCAGCRRPGSW